MKKINQENQNKLGYYLENIYGKTIDKEGLDYNLSYFVDNNASYTNFRYNENKEFILDYIENKYIYLIFIIIIILFIIIIKIRNNNLLIFITYICLFFYNGNISLTHQF